MSNKAVKHFIAAFLKVILGEQCFLCGFKAIGCGIHATTSSDYNQRPCSAACTEPQALYKEVNMENITKCQPA